VDAERQQHGAAGGGELAPLETGEQKEGEGAHRAIPSLAHAWMPEMASARCAGLAVTRGADALPDHVLVRRPPNSFHTPATSAAAPIANSLANLSTNAPISASSPSFFAAMPPTSAAMP